MMQLANAEWPLNRSNSHLKYLRKTYLKQVRRTHGIFDRFYALSSIRSYTTNSSKNPGEARGGKATGEQRIRKGRDKCC